MPEKNELYFEIKDPDYARDLFDAFKKHTGKRLRQDHYLEFGEYFTLAIDLETFQARIVKHWSNQ